MKSQIEWSNDKVFVDKFRLRNNPYLRLDREESMIMMAWERMANLVLMVKTLFHIRKLL